ncbi:hypothetical protein BB561_006876 [Smittium simulii]|uniref:G-patch domain-containing protein n=1 Tax=Smittium simulii TaxID=133385 RepID=A0A2T9Y0N7_9FUNG|nr:hypothetical protein BB561_006876 [Smittium simulii]
MGLSESRRRTKISDDPRNQTWGNDKNKFGYRLMQKMGWSEGKGLGSNETGIAEHLKIRLKTNNLGIGATVKNSDNWLSNSTDFEKLLAKLNNEQAQTAPENAQNGSESNLDSKNTQKNEPETLKTAPSSQNSQAAPSGNIRFAHRAKFRKMKQMASMETQGLQEILGVRKSNSATSISENSDLQKNISAETDLVSDAKIKTSTLTIEEYFAQKNVSNPFKYTLEPSSAHADDYSVSSFVGFNQGPSMDLQESEIDTLNNSSNSSPNLNENQNKRKNKETSDSPKKLSKTNDSNAPISLNNIKPEAKNEIKKSSKEKKSKESKDKKKDTKVKDKKIEKKIKEKSKDKKNKEKSKDKKSKEKSKDKKKL